MSDDVATLVLRCRAGDRDAESALAHRAAARALQVAAVAMGDVHAAHDVRGDGGAHAARARRPACSSSSPCKTSDAAHSNPPATRSRRSCASSTSLGNLAIGVARPLARSIVPAVAAAVAVPTTRTAVGSAVDAFFGGHAPGHEVNGRVLDRSELPRWLDRGVHRALLVAGSGEHRLIAYRSGPTAYCFDYGTQVGECATAEIWEKLLAEHPVVLLGPTSGRGHPRGAFYGFTRGDVTAVRLTFDAHAAITASAANGGFALTTDARWQPRRLVLLGRGNRTIATIDVSGRYR